jgi:hypothetical protein
MCGGVGGVGRNSVYTILGGVLVLVLVLHGCAVTVSSTGAENQFQGDDNGHVGRPCQVSPALPFPELL